MKQILNNTPDDDNLDLVDVDTLKALRAEALERKALDKLREEIQPNEDGELEAAELTLADQAKIERAKLASPLLDFILPIDLTEDDLPIPDGHLYHEYHEYHEPINGEDLED